VSSNFGTDDPLFLTGDSYTIPLGDTHETLYPPAFMANSMGCIEQHRLCNPTVADGCTPYRPYLTLQDVPGLLTTINFNPTQLAAAERISTAIYPSLTFNSVVNRRGAALLASHTMSDLLQTAALPVDQWRIEVDNWFAVSLAKLQQAILNSPRGLWILQWFRTFSTPPTPAP
jgi:hypothetical protein